MDLLRCRYVSDAVCASQAGGLIPLSTCIQDILGTMWGSVRLVLEEVEIVGG